MVPVKSFSYTFGISDSCHMVNKFILASGIKQLRTCAKYNCFQVTVCLSDVSFPPFFHTALLLSKNKVIKSEHCLPFKEWLLRREQSLSDFFFLKRDYFYKKQLLSG